MLFFRLFPQQSERMADVWLFHKVDRKNLQVQKSKEKLFIFLFPGPMNTFAKIRLLLSYHHATHGLRY